MIILRDKNYSAASKIIKAKNKIINAMDNGIIRLEDRLGDATGIHLYKSSYRNPGNYGRKSFKLVSDPTKEQIQAMKLERFVRQPEVVTAETLRNGAQKIKEGLVNGAIATTKAAEQAAYGNAGELINKGVKIVAENPISAISEAAGVPINAAIYAASPAAGAAVMASPIGPSKIGVAGEQWIKSAFPEYGKATKRLSNYYGKSRVAETIRNYVPNLQQISYYAGQYGPLL